jgi:hypothetical protein
MRKSGALEADHRQRAGSGRAFPQEASLPLVDERFLLSEEGVPAFVPDLIYADMEIGDSGMAMLGYLKMCEFKDPVEVARLRKALPDYCRLDTLRMVKLFEKLRKI